MSNMRYYRAVAFTLAELLIALAILGVIATFTIPKVLVSSNNSKFNAIGKETAAMVSGAYQAYLMEHTLTNTVSMADLTPYMNYVSVDTANVNNIDRIPGNTSIRCDTTNRCLRLHNGAAVLYNPADYFDGTSTTNSVYFYVDPDGQYSGSASGNGKSIVFFLYANGRITTWGNLLAGTWNNGQTYTATPANDPDWFSWN